MSVRFEGSLTLWLARRLALTLEIAEAETARRRRPFCDGESRLMEAAILGCSDELNETLRPSVC